MRFTLASFLLCSLLCACGGGGSNSNSALTAGSGAAGGTLFCDSISGGGATITTNIDSGCVGCSVSDISKAADGDLSTFANANMAATAAGQGVSLRATAQPGIVYPAGDNATVFLTSQTGGTTVALVSSGIMLRTYLSGSLQETAAGPPAFDCGSCGPGQSAYGYVSFQTAKVFDALEIQLSPATNPNGSSFKIYEICSNGGRR